MSIRRLPRQMGLAVICNGTDETDCNCGEGGQPAKFHTGVIRADYTRAWIKKEGWGRGLRKNRKRNDLCPYHFKLERFLVYQQEWRRVLDKEAKDALRIAKVSGAPLPKKSRKKSSPSADIAQAPAT